MIIAFYFSFYSSSCFDDSILSCDFNLEPAPPLPPKRKLLNSSNTSNEQSRIYPTGNSTSLCGSCGSINTELNSLCTIDWTSPCSQSPENLTPISKSSASSLDSNLNNSIDDLSYTKYKYLKCSDTQEFSFSKQHFQPGFTSQTYNCELSSYTSTMTTATTSISLHSNGALEDTSDLLETVNEISVTNSEIKYNSSSSSSTAVTKFNSSSSSSSTTAVTTTTNSPNHCEPPALPVKLRKLRNNTISQYDNMPQLLVSDAEVSCFT